MISLNVVCNVSGRRGGWRFLLACLLLLAVPSWAQDGARDGEQADALEQLVVLMGEIQSLRAEVEQLFMDQDGREIEQADALLLLEKPDNFYWEITSPYEYLLVTDGETIWQYEPDLEQVTIEDFANNVDSSPLVLLSGDAASIAQSYVVDLERMDPDVRRFTLRPLQASNLYESLSITFHGETLRSMHWESAQGQQTNLSFNTLERNPDIEPARFSFQPPAGVDIIDSRSASE